jgi:hypothetical protein
MRTWRTVALALGGLGAVAAAVLPMMWRGPAPDVAADRHVPPAAPAQHPNDVETWKAASLVRPLFSRGRRPPAESRQVVAATLPVAAPRLTGVLVGPFGANAVFMVGGSDKPVTVQEGDQVGAYRIRRITPGEVLVDGPDGERVLRPSFGSAPDRRPAPDQRAAVPSSRLASRP